MITDKKEKELYDKIDKKWWIYDDGEYRLHHSATDILIDTAESLNIAIVAVEGYRYINGRFEQHIDYTYDFEEYNDLETWEEKLRESIAGAREAMRKFIRPKLDKEKDEIYLTHYFDERGDLKLVK
jgi:hypothetical protein